MDPAAPKASAEDGAFYWSRNLSQIIFAQEAAVGHHVFMDEMRYATRIEITDALVCQSAQRSREHRLAEAGAGGIGGAVRLQEEASCRPGLEVFKFAGCELVLERCDLVPLFGKTYCRGQTAGEFPGCGRKAPRRIDRRCRRARVPLLRATRSIGVVPESATPLLCRPVLGPEPCFCDAVA